MENELYEVTSYIFNKINPAKRFSEFTFYDVEFSQVNVGDCEKGMILRIEGNYFMFNKQATSNLSVKIASKIYFKEGRNVVKEIEV